MKDIFQSTSQDVNLKPMIRKRKKLKMRTDYLLVFGTFNPITNAHIALIEEAKKQIRDKNTKVILIPSNLNFMQEWKDVDMNFMSNEDRLNILEDISKERGYKLCTLEALGEVDGKTYNTVQALNLPKNARVYFVYGDDKISEFAKWYKALELFGNKNYTFLISTRSLHDPKRITHYLKHLGLVRNFKVFTLEDNTYSNISSTLIRKAYIDNDMKFIKKYVPDKVYEFLINKLFKSAVPQNMKEYQNQVLQILEDSGYNFNQADLVRKAMKENEETVRGD